MKRVTFPPLIVLPIVLLLGACASDPLDRSSTDEGKVVCDSYIILDMCVRDLTSDGVVDMVYFSDSKEIFMYRAGRKTEVGKVMPFHRCVVALSAEMQETTNRILQRENLGLGEELEITKELISNYLAAKPQIDACNASFEDSRETKSESPDDFFVEEDPWEG